MWLQYFDFNKFKCDSTCFALSDEMHDINNFTNPAVIHSGMCLNYGARLDATKRELEYKRRHRASCHITTESNINTKVDSACVIY